MLGAGCTQQRVDCDQELASQRKKVQDRWREHYDQLTAGQDYKDRETPRLKRLLKEGQHMADAGYMPPVHYRSATGVPGYGHRRAGGGR